MKLLFVVQRYGDEVAGGAEAHCRMFAERLASRGHTISVVTSCARDYDTWEDHYPPGVTTVQGVTIHRLPVVAPRDRDRFDALSRRVAVADVRRPIVEDAWMREQGPTLDGLDDVLRAAAGRVDVVIFFTYLYATTSLGMRAVRGLVPTVLHPTAHDEWPMRLPIIREAVEHADGLALSTPEERALVELRCRPTSLRSVIGIGFEAPPPPSPSDLAEFRHRFGLGDEPYVLCLGRVDPNKGAVEAMDFMAEHRRRGGRARLVMCGADMMQVDRPEGAVITGFVDDRTRWAAIRGAEVLLQPSRQESFGMTLAEAWLCELPVMVQAACDVTAGLVARSRGGLAYNTYSDFDAVLDVLLERRDLRTALGANGARFVRDTLSWDAVLGRYESFLDDVSSTARLRPITA